MPASEAIAAAATNVVKIRSYRVIVGLSWLRITLRRWRAARAAKIDRRGADDSHSASLAEPPSSSLNAESTTLETAEISAESSTAPALTNLIQFRLASNRPAPQVGQGTISLFASETGEDVLVAWAQAERVLYVTSKGNDWNAVREIRLTDSVDLQRAYAILAQRLSSH